LSLRPTFIAITAPFGAAFFSTGRGRTRIRASRRSRLFTMLTRRLRARFASCYRLATSRRSIDFCTEVVLLFFVFFLFFVVIEFIIVVFLLFFVLFFIEVVVIIVVVFFVPEVEVFIVVFSDAHDFFYFVVLFVFIV
jgi:hypothetical protein